MLVWSHVHHDLLVGNVHFKANVQFFVCSLHLRFAHIILNLILVHMFRNRSTIGVMQSLLEVSRTAVHVGARAGCGWQVSNGSGLMGSAEAQARLACQIAHHEFDKNGRVKGAQCM